VGWQQLDLLLREQLDLATDSILALDSFSELGNPNVIQILFLSLLDPFSECLLVLGNTEVK
jgi:hypothetical protein